MPPSSVIAFSVPAWPASEASRSDWKRAITSGVYAFAHALVGQTIYAELSSARRMRLHRQVGEALEALVDVESHVEALAYHFAEAAQDGQAEKAASYALAAGRSATARLPTRRRPLTISAA